MKSFDSDLKKYAEKVKLKAAERRELRERVLAYMEYHPLPKKQEAIAVEKIESERFVTIHFNTIYTRIIAGAFAMFALIIVPIAAERSVPGDVLYLVKTHVTEGIQGQFANSAYERVEFETKLMERRIAEARLLASEGKLTDEVEAEIAETVKGHAVAAQAGIAALRVDDEEGAAIAEISFGSALEVQSAVLDTEDGEDETTSVESIKEVVKVTQAEVTANKSTATPSFEGLMGRIEFETTRAYELFESVKESATDAEKADIERRLGDVGRKITKAQELHTMGDQAATSELATTLGMLQKLVVFMTDIDVREHVALETLVPVELTDEERVDAARNILNEVQVTEAEVSLRVRTLEDEAVLEKAALGLTELRSLIEAATIALQDGDINALEISLASANALVHDLDALTTGGEGEILEQDTTLLDEEGGGVWPEEEVQESPRDGEGAGAADILSE